MKRTRMKAVSDRRRKRDAVYARNRQAAYERAEGRCEVAGPDCTGSAEQTHHLEGRVGPDPHRIDNLLICCASCHATIHRFPEWSRAHGWMRSRLGGVA